MEVNNLYSVTINTDASFCHETKACGYAIWITYSKDGDKKKITFFGNFTNKKPLHSGFAESMAVLNGLQMVLNTLEPFTRIYINCDYINAEPFIKKNNLLKKVFSDICSKFPVQHKIYFRHVKAHNKEDQSPRGYINDWLDRMARKAMKEERTQIKKTHKKSKHENNLQLPSDTRTK